jgi:nickel-dependent lactate racemase
MVQAHKGMENAAGFVRDGGVLILAAECREGWGNPIFERWMKAADSPQAVLNRIQQEFEFGGHKAAGIANIVSRMSVFLVSAMPEAEVRRMFLEPVASLETALEAARAQLGAGSQILALPEAGSIIPVRG